MATIFARIMETRIITSKKVFQAEKNYLQSIIKELYLHSFDVFRVDFTISHFILGVFY